MQQRLDRIGRGKITPVELTYQLMFGVKGTRGASTDDTLEMVLRNGRKECLDVFRGSDGASHSYGYLPALALFYERDNIFDFLSEWDPFASKFDRYIGREPVDPLQGIAWELADNLEVYIAYFKQGFGCLKEVNEYSVLKYHYEFKDLSDQELVATFAPGRPNTELLLKVAGEA